MEVSKFVDNLHYEKIMKKAYLTFVEHTKLVSWRNYDQAIFMVNCLVGQVDPVRALPSQA